MFETVNHKPLILIIIIILNKYKDKIVNSYFILLSWKNLNDGNIKSYQRFNFKVYSHRFIYIYVYGGVIKNNFR